MLSEERLRNSFSSPVEIVRLDAKVKRAKVKNIVYTSIDSLMNDYNHDVLITVLYL